MQFRRAALGLQLLPPSRKFRLFASVILSGTLCATAFGGSDSQPVKYADPSGDGKTSIPISRSGSQGGGNSSGQDGVGQGEAARNTSGHDGPGQGASGQGTASSQQKPVNEIPKDYSGKPYRSLIQIIPGTIQAEHYDVAPDKRNGISYNSHGQPQVGPYRISGDCIDVHRFGKGHKSVIGRREPADQVYVAADGGGEWWKYTVQVRETGTYLMSGHFAVQDDDTQISVSFGSEITAGSIHLPQTSGKQSGEDWSHTWETTDTLTEVTLPAGLYVMTVKVDRGAGLNFDYLTFTRKKEAGPAAPKDKDLNKAFSFTVQSSSQPVPLPPNSNPPSL